MKWGYFMLQNPSFVHNTLIASEGKEKNNADRTSFEKKIIRNFTDILILKHLQKAPLVSGYEILNYLRKKCDIPFSPGTIYGTIYSLERNGLIKGNGPKTGRTYIITVRGRETLSSIIKASIRIQSIFIELILG
jgi:DNA-binding PadR family transcriptional regulator